MAFDWRQPTGQFESYSEFSGNRGARCSRQNRNILVGRPVLAAVTPFPVTRWHGDEAKSEECEHDNEGECGQRGGRVRENELKLKMKIIFVRFLPHNAHTAHMMMTVLDDCVMCDV